MAEEQQKEAIPTQEKKNMVMCKGVKIKFSKGVEDKFTKEKIGFYNRPSSSHPESVTLLCIMDKQDVKKTIKSGTNPNWVKVEKTGIGDKKEVEELGKVKENEGLLLGKTIKLLIAKEANNKIASGLSVLEIKPDKEYIICLKEEEKEYKDNPAKIPLSTSLDKIWSVDGMVQEEMEKQE